MNRFDKLSEVLTEFRIKYVPYDLFSAMDTVLVWCEVGATEFCMDIPMNIIAMNTTVIPGNLFFAFTNS